MSNYCLRIGLAAGAMCAATLLSVPANADSAFMGAKADKSSYNAIFHIDDGGEATIKKTLNNIENLLNDPRLKGKVHVELLANSKGFAVYVKNNGFEEKLRHLQKEGVILSQCSNTLKELHIDRGNLYPFISIVPSGMGEITIRESEGWAYIHPTPPPASQL
jgi:intracellular sulfur oxidation DsrE/DsrF family protein